MSLSDTEEKALSFIDEQELVNLAVDLGNIYGPIGYEDQVGEFVYEWLTSNGIEAFKQGVVENRFNVVGRIPGTGGGSSLLFNSHMECDDGGPGEEWVLPDPTVPYYTQAWMEGDKIFGKPVLNDRGPMSAFMMAAKAIKESEVKLKGDLVLTMVVGEVGSAPIDEFQGTRYLGKGLGSRHLVNHGVVADQVLVAETTDFSIAWAECGAAYIKITVHGEAIYTPRSYRADRIEDHPNAIVKMARLIQKLDEWGARYEKDNRYKFAGGEMVPRVAVGGIRGGLPSRPYRTSGVCSIYVDVRIPPGKSVLEVKRQLEELVRSLKMEADIQIYMYRAGYEGKNVSRIKKSVEESYFKIRKKKPEKVPTAVTSMWRDINVFNEVGIPAITFGPPRHQAEGVLKYMARQDLVDTSKTYTLVAMDVCGVEQAGSTAIKK